MSSNRLGHYVKPGRRPMIPAVAFGVCIEPTLDNVPNDPDATGRAWGSASAWTSRRVGGRWRHPHGITTSDPSELFGWMAKYARADARNYVLAPVASDVLTISGFWRMVDREGSAWEPVGSKRRGTPGDGVTRFRRLVLKGKPDIIDFTRHGRRWVWLSLGQYFDMDEDKVAAGIKCPWIDTGRYDDTGTVGERTASERSHLCLRAFTHLADWWAKHSRSPFGFTAGQLAWGVLRTHVKPRTLCTHNLPHVHQLERAACHGGRATTWYVGDVGDPAAFDSWDRPAPPRSKYGSFPGPLHLVDVRSMYPVLLRDNEFPVKLWSAKRGYTVKEIVTASRSYGVLARVRIRATCPEFAYRGGNRVTFPTGEFSSVLVSPELSHARNTGSVVAVEDAALYDLAPAFRDAAGELIRMREDARRAGNFCEEFFAKLLANSLGGKLAQRKGQWHERRKVPAAVHWGEWYQGRGEDGKPRRFRSVCGLVWEWVTDRAGAGPHTAAFAHLTALGRLWMARIRAACPPYSVVSQDTDGLWVTDAGLAAIKAAGHVFGDRAGELCVKHTVEAARFFGPRHYWTPLGWVLAGFNQPQMHIDGTSVTDTRVDNPARRTSDGAPDTITTRVRRCQLKIEAPGMEVFPDGWCRARHLG